MTFALGAEAGRMLSRNLALLAVAALVLPSLPRPALAAAPAPITVQSCELDSNHGALAVRFTNVSQKVISNVHFAVTSTSNVLDMKDDAGSFAPGDKVSHRLRVGQVFFEIWGKVGCAPASVTFADGTSWSSPTVASDMVHATVQTPGSNIALQKCFTGENVYVDYTNTARQNATEVDFGLMQHGVLVWTARDPGTFSPGTLIQRGWQLIQPDTYDKRFMMLGYAVDSDMLQNRCIVTSVKYEDGSSWTNPSVPTQSIKGIPFTMPSPLPQAPLELSNCDGSSTGHGGSWRLDYHNLTQKKIVAADFALIMHGIVYATARDTHDLAPDESTHRAFPLWDDNVFQPACLPIRVDYADGTEWINPLFAPAKD